MKNEPTAETRPLDSALNLIGWPIKLEARQNTLQFYPEIVAAVYIPDYIPDRKVSGPRSTFFLVPKKNTKKVHGRIDLCRLNRQVQYQHFKMEGAHPLQMILCHYNYLITKVNLSDFYMHLPIDGSSVSCSKVPSTIVWSCPLASS